MAKSVISYDKDLPEVPGHCAWQPPASWLFKALWGGCKMPEPPERPSQG